MKTALHNYAHQVSQLKRKQAIAWPLALFCLSLATTLPAQTVTIRANPVRITVPAGVAATNTSTVTIVTAGLAEPTNVTFAVTGVPSGATAVLSTNLIVSNGTYSATLTVTATTALPVNTYDLAIEASGAAAFRLPVPLMCSYLWSGADFANGGTPNFSTPANWQGGAKPGSTVPVVFSDLGGTTNTSGVNTTNVIVTADAEIASLRFAQQAGATRYYNMQLNTGVTLKVSGPGGFSMLRDSKGVGQAMDVRIFGSGSLVVTNAEASFATLIDAQQNATLDLRGLDNLQFQGSRLMFGDYRAYPNFYTNGWIGTGTGGEINRFVSLVYLARTNLIKASFVDPNNYTDLGRRDYSLTIGNNSIQGSTSNLRLSLGYSNAFFLDSICFGQALAGGSGNNYSFVNSGSSALFRGAAGMASRMSVFAISDAASPAAPAAANCRSQVNFSNGFVDALVDQLWVSVDRTNNNGQMTLQGSLTLAAGTFDANSVYAGYQKSGDNLGSSASTGFAGPEGTVTLNGTSVLKVNTTLHLGYTTASAVGGTTTPERTFGKIIIGTGTLMANNIAVGGVTKLSTNNSIAVGGGRLIVTNGIGSATAPLTALVSTNGSQWTLHSVTAGQTSIFVRQLNCPVSGARTRINVPSLSDVTTWPVTVPLISYTVAGPIYNGLEFGTLPSGVVGISIVENQFSQTIDFTFDTNQPKVLVWRGTVDNSWDTVTTNWIKQSDGLPAKFTDGDSVVFDDTATGSTAINIAGMVVPGQTAASYGIVVSNSTVNYSFTSGAVLGGSTLLKVGAKSLSFDAAMAPGLVINGGTFGGLGSVGPTTLGSGSTMTNFQGTISGGLEVSNANVSVISTVNGGLVVRAGGITNVGTINGTVVLQSGGLIDNQSTMNVTLPWTVSTNATLVNNGTIYQFGVPNANLGLTVNGTLKGVGRITQNGFQASSDVRVTMGAGGTLMVGNQPNEITNVTIAVRLDFNNTSTSTFDVDTAQGRNDQIMLSDPPLLGKVNFGVGNNLGGTLAINKLAGPAFNSSSVLNLFDLTSNQPDNSQPAIPQVVPGPAPGLSWDLTQMLTNLTLRVGLPAMMTNAFGSTNIVFSWSPNNLGWRLERQTNSLAVGLDSKSTNWTTLFIGLAGTNSLYYPDITNQPDFYYYRSVQPIDTNLPSAFYRLAYP
jgi:hypothetical protein